MIYYNKIFTMVIMVMLSTSNLNAIVGIINTQTVVSSKKEEIKKAITKKSKKIKKEIDKYKKVLENGNKILKENLKESQSVLKLKEIILKDLMDLDKNLKKQIEEKRIWKK